MQSAEREDGRRYAAWFRTSTLHAAFMCSLRRGLPTSAIQLSPFFETCEREILKLVYEKEDLLVSHQGKDKNYNFYKVAGVVTALGGKGEHFREMAVDIKTNLP